MYDQVVLGEPLVENVHAGWLQSARVIYCSLSLYLIVPWSNAVGPDQAWHSRKQRFHAIFQAFAGCLDLPPRSDQGKYSQSSSFLFLVFILAGWISNLLDHSYSYIPIPFRSN